MTTPETIVAEVYLFDTCTHRCGYCGLAESGLVLDTSQLNRFRDPAQIDQIAAFFNSRSADRRWLLQFTGGEPLLMPNLDRLCDALIEGGNKIAFYTALLLDEQHPGFRYLMSRSAEDVDYVMGSFHPESELDEERQFAKFKLLKERGHNLIFRYVGHPDRLARLQHFSDRCREIDVCFYPTTLFSNRYPTAYTSAERESLEQHFTSLSQFVQLHGGIETTGTRCHAGSRLVSVNMQTGDITPCITVGHPLMGNVFRNELNLFSAPINCPQPGISCICDVHFQQDIVIGADDAEMFTRLKGRFVDRSEIPPGHIEARLQQMASAELKFYRGTSMGIGGVEDDRKLILTKQEVKATWHTLRREKRAVSIAFVPGSSAGVGERLYVEVSIPPTEGQVAMIEAFVNEALDGAGTGVWRALPRSDSQPDDGERFRFSLDTGTLALGDHRVGINVHLTTGAIVNWYDQPAHICRVVPRAHAHS